MNPRIKKFLDVAAVRMMEDKDRDDAKVTALWTGLFHDLRKLLSKEDIAILDEGWDRIAREVGLSRWDDAFHMAVIDQDTLSNRLGAGVPCT